MNPIIIKAVIAFAISGIFAYEASHAGTIGMGFWLGMMSTVTFFTGIGFLFQYAERN